MTTAPETPSPSGTVGAIAWKAAAVALLAATTLLGAAGQAVAATPEAAPSPAQSTVLTPHQQRAARQGADLAQRTSTAVTNAVVDAANRIAAQNPDRPVTINIRDITVAKSC